MLNTPKAHWTKLDADAAAKLGLGLEFLSNKNVRIWNLPGHDAETALVRLFDAAAKGYAWALKALYLSGRPTNDKIDIPTGRV